MLVRNSVYTQEIHRWYVLPLVDYPTLWLNISSRIYYIPWFKWLNFFRFFQDSLLVNWNFDFHHFKISVLFLKDLLLKFLFYTKKNRKKKEKLEISGNTKNVYKTCQQNVKGAPPKAKTIEFLLYKSLVGITRIFHGFPHI